MMMSGVYPYLRMNGNGKEAVEFYKNSLDAELIGVQTYGELPENPEFPLSEDMKDLVVHAQLKFGNTFLMLSDNLPGDPYEIGTQLNIAVLITDVEKTKEIFEKLQVGGEVIVPLQETPFSPAYGQVKDKYSITWQISTVGE